MYLCIYVPVNNFSVILAQSLSFLGNTSTSGSKRTQHSGGRFVIKISKKKLGGGEIQFNTPFKIISLIETSQSIDGAKQEYPGKTT